MFREKKLPEELQKTLKKYEELNGTLQYVILKYDEEKLENIYHLCQAAAIEGLKTLRKHDEEFYKAENYSKKEIEKNLSVYEIFDETPRGVILTIEEFFGPYFDIKKQKLIMRGKPKDFLNTYFYADVKVGDESEENIVFDLYSVDNLPNSDKLREIYNYSVGYAVNGKFFLNLL
ncbi:MAG: hypothetical protein ACTSRG_14580 [Candidatus Helarchaeota archaeon]